MCLAGDRERLLAFGSNLFDRSIESYGRGRKAAQYRSPCPVVGFRDGVAVEAHEGDPKLEACSLHDPAHITAGATGRHVAKIQFALLTLDGATISARELSHEHYGPSTADAVLKYKQKRDIVNRSYQKTADSIVGKMTIIILDKEMVDQENGTHPRSCELLYYPAR